MRLGTWYIPSATGDFRLEDAPADLVRNKLGATSEIHSLLTVEDPTPAEIEKLSTFIATCRQRKWIESFEGVSPRGRSELLIRSPVSQCGLELAGAVMPSRGTLTVVKTSAGQIIATVDSGVEARASLQAVLEAIERATSVTVDPDLKQDDASVNGSDHENKPVTDASSADASITTWDTGGKGRKQCSACKKYVGTSRKSCACGHSFDKQIPAPSTEQTTPVTATATTVRRGTTCCPDPIEGPLKRSSRVLREFCTKKQWQDWIEKGWLVCFGGSTGYAYRLAHRHHPLAAVQQKICWDLDHGCYIKFWDWSVPPAEEVLAAKLILEHREPWLRNRSTTFGARGSVIFTNPLGNWFMDGTWDAALFRSLGDPIVSISAGTGAIIGLIT